MLTVSQAHIKHNLIVVVDGSWLLSLPLFVQSNKKLAQLGSIVKMLSNKQGCPNWDGPWLATSWLMGSATLALHIKRALYLSRGTNEAPSIPLMPQPHAPLRTRFPRALSQNPSLTLEWPWRLARLHWSRIKMVLWFFYCDFIESKMVLEALGIVRFGLWWCWLRSTMTLWLILALPYCVMVGLSSEYLFITESLILDLIVIPCFSLLVPWSLAISWKHYDVRSRSPFFPPLVIPTRRISDFLSPSSQLRQQLGTGCRCLTGAGCSISMYWIWLYFFLRLLL
jgi:hypothetical protein